jgi:hypothetical protein
VFFYKAVCGMEEVDLEVRLRKTEPRIPVVLNVKEVMAVFDKIDEKYGLMAASAVSKSCAPSDGKLAK